MTERDELSVSVLICTYNRHQLLRKALTALLRESTCKPDQVVIVNGGDNDTDRIVEEFRKFSSVRIELISTINVNLATSRNIGLGYCTGDIVAMTDDDAEVFPNWIDQIRLVHTEHPEAGAIGGPVVGAKSDTSFLSRLADTVTFPRPSLKTYVRTLPGVNVSYKRVVLDTVGVQDETLFRGEDVDFNWRVLKAGFKILFDPSIVVTHHHRNSLRTLLKQHHMYGRAYYLVRKKWPEMYCVYPHSLSSPRDLLKLGNFIASTFYDPLLTGVKFKKPSDKVLAIPSIFLNHISWKSGMVVQWWHDSYAETRK